MSPGRSGPPPVRKQLTVLHLAAALLVHRRGPHSPWLPAGPVPALSGARVVLR